MVYAKDVRQNLIRGADGSFVPLDEETSRLFSNLLASMSGFFVVHFSLQLQ
jgi:hypothetical protein